MFETNKGLLRNIYSGKEVCLLIYIEYAMKAVDLLQFVCVCVCAFVHECVCVCERMD